MRRRRGFTLLEIVVALAVFAVIGVLSSQLLMRMVDITRAAESRGNALVDLQRALDVLQRDLEQITYRGIRNEFGDPEDPIRLGARGLVEFTRTGWRNPLGEPRSELQRVAFTMSEGSLYRLYWDVLDRAPNSEPVIQAVLDGVTRASVRAVDQWGNRHAFWPPLANVEEIPYIAAVAVDLELESVGRINRIFLIPTDPVFTHTDLGTDEDAEADDDE